MEMDHHSNDSKPVGDRQRQDRLVRLCRAYRLRQGELLLRQNAMEQRQKELSAALIEAQFQLGRINSEMEEELETAQRIQEGLLPKELPEIVNLKSAAMYIPAGKVGGDLYDIITTPRQKIAILIYDVSGHGIPAALIGAMAKMLFAHYIEKTDSPAEVFHHVNKDLCRFIHTEQYLTAFLGLIDPVNNVMLYARAGHVPPLVFHAGDRRVTRLDAKGFFIGHSALLSIAEYCNETVRLEPGDKLLFYTDGLTEGYNGRGALYGVERLKEAFADCGDREVRSIIDTIVENQAGFREGTPLRDDFTLLCIQIGDSEQLLAGSGFSREDEPSILVAMALHEIDSVCSVILREMDRYGFTDQNIKQFKICVFEMMTNAILHGNGGDPRKKVLVFYKVTKMEAIISVVDEGKGFDYNDIPDPLLPENRMRDHGRGLFLIRHYCDEVAFNAAGNRIMGRKLQRRR
ncbi:MAG: SpoIIE family protein phosphatase [Chitinispirillaceae bacterium]|nr:SpoIIE family protein phosphatase [Chitinispirillaceae bacterium]